MRKNEVRRPLRSKNFQAWYCQRHLPYLTWFFVDGFILPSIYVKIFLFRLTFRLFFFPLPTRLFTSMGSSSEILSSSSRDAATSLGCANLIFFFFFFIKMNMVAPAARNFALDYGRLKTTKPWKWRPPSMSFPPFIYIRSSLVQIRIWVRFYPSALFDLFRCLSYPPEKGLV